MKKFLLTLALCVSTTTASVSAANFGVCSHMGLGNNYDNVANIEAAENVKVAWIRDECRWSNMQSGSDGELKIRDKDMDYIKRVDDAGKNQLLILAYGNPSYDGVAADNVLPEQDNATYYNGFLDYVRYTVGQVKDYVDAYEIWNEPNISGFNYNMQATGEDYAKLYLDAKAIIDELDPSATVVCGSITGSGDEDISYGKEIFDYIKSQGDVNKLVDAFSIHIYTRDIEAIEGAYFDACQEWEDMFDSYGFTGEVWMTENGVSSNTGNNTEEEQAKAVAKLGVQWENYLKSNNRKGINFWYDLRNDGTDAAEYEHNLGLVKNDYTIKPAGYAMAAYNELTGDKVLDSVTKIKTKDNFITSDEYGYVAKYSNDIETAYIVYDSYSNGETTDIALSGDVAYVYDYLGNLTETITNPSGTKSITMASEPVMVECITYGALINSLEYDADNGVMTVSGEFNYGDSVTVEVLKNNEVVESYQTAVNEGNFTKWFSLMDSGDYVIRVGQPEIVAIGRTDGWAEQTYSIAATGTNPAFAASTAVVYNAENRTVSVSGALTDYVENQYVTVLAIPASMDVANVDMNAIGYIKQIPTTDGEFSINFELPEYYTTKTAIYLGGTGINTKSTNYAEIAENPYVYVASFEIGKEDKLSASAIVRNYAETERKASIMIAQYSTDGRLEDIRIEEKTIPAKTYATVECSLKDIVIDGDATYAKAFIWSDTTGLVPLANFDDTAVNN